MMQKVIERILNLLAYLLTVERPVTADEIRHTVAGYDRDSDTAFHRTFERDKDLLRRLGIPIEREATDVFEVEFGYVVHDDRYALEDPGLTDEERTALALAVQAVGFGGRPSGQEALMKLGGAVGSLDGTELGADLGEQAETVAASVRGDLGTTHVVVRVSGSRSRSCGRTASSIVAGAGIWWRPMSRATTSGSTGSIVPTPLIAGDRAGAFTIPDGFDPADAVLHHPWDAGRDVATASVVFDEEVAWIAERELGPNTVIERRSDGSIIGNRRTRGTGSVPRLAHRFRGSGRDRRATGSPRPVSLIGGRIVTNSPKTAGRINRLLAMLPWVIANPGAPVDEVCERFGYTRTDLIKDLNTVFVCGLPGYGPGDLMDASIDDDEVIVELAEYFARPLRLTAPEALGILASGKAVQSAGSGGKALDRAIAKLERTLLPDGADAVVVDLPEPSLVGDLRRAANDGDVVRIDHTSIASGERRVREIEPWSVFTTLGNWYVSGHCRTADAERVFRIDRIRTAEATGERFDAKPASSSSSRALHPKR